MYVCTRTRCAICKITPISQGELYPMRSTTSITRRVSEEARHKRGELPLSPYAIYLPPDTAISNYAIYTWWRDTKFKSDTFSCCLRAQIHTYTRTLARAHYIMPFSLKIHRRLKIQHFDFICPYHTASYCHMPWVNILPFVERWLRRSAVHYTFSTGRSHYIPPRDRFMKYAPTVAHR